MKTLLILFLILFSLNGYAAEDPCLTEQKNLYSLFFSILDNYRTKEPCLSPDCATLQTNQEHKFLKIPPPECELLKLAAQYRQIAEEFDESANYYIQFPLRSDYTGHDEKWWNLIYDLKPLAISYKRKAEKAEKAEQGIINKQLTKEYMWLARLYERMGMPRGALSTIISREHRKNLQLQGKWYRKQAEAMEQKAEEYEQQLNELLIEQGY